MLRASNVITLLTVNQGYDNEIIYHKISALCRRILLMYKHKRNRGNVSRNMIK